MSFLQRLSAAAAILAGGVTETSDEGWAGDVDAPFMTAAGVPVTARSVLKLSLYVTCAQKIAKSVGVLPVKVYERKEDGQKAEAKNHPLSDLLHRQPNAEQTALEFKMAMTWDLATWRAAYAQIKPGPRGAVDQLIHLPAETSKPCRVNGRWWLQVPAENGIGTRLLSRDEVFSISLAPFGPDGVTPTPVFELGRETFSKALALQEYANSFFQNAGGSGPWISFEGKGFATDEERDTFVGWLKGKLSPRHRHEPKPLPFNAKVTPGGVKNNEAQFLETWTATAREIIALFDIPPHKVGDLERATFTNIEQQSLEFVQDCLMVYLTAWEQAITRDLIVRKDKYFAEFLLAAFLRGDLQSRYLAYAIGRQWGWLSVNDILEKENLNGIGPAGDIYLTPLNMVDVSNPAPQDAAAGTKALFAALEAADADHLCAALKSLKQEQGVTDAA